MQPETRSLPPRASHRPQSRDTPRVLLIQAGREPQPAIQLFSANTHCLTENHKQRQTDHFVSIVFQGKPRNVYCKVSLPGIVSKNNQPEKWYICIQQHFIGWKTTLLRKQFTQFSPRKSALKNQILSHQLLITVLSTSVLLTPYTSPSATTVHCEQCWEVWTGNNIKMEVGTSHTTVTCYACSPQHGHELELKSVRWTDRHEIICTSKSILLLSNKEALTADLVWGRVLLIVCSQRQRNRCLQGILGPCVQVICSAKQLVQKDCQEKAW